MKGKIKRDDLASASNHDLSKIINEENDYDNYIVYLAKKELKQRGRADKIEKIKLKNESAKIGKAKIIDFSKIYAIGFVFTLLIIIGLFINYCQAPVPATNYNLYDSYTIGKITEIRMLDAPSQSREGNRFVVYAYLICFDYVVNNKFYSNEMTLPNNSQTDKIIKKLRNSIGQNRIYIRYNSKNPKKSVVELERL